MVRGPKPLTILNHGELRACARGTGLGRDEGLCWRVGLGFIGVRG